MVQVGGLPTPLLPSFIAKTCLIIRSSLRRTTWPFHTHYVVVWLGIKISYINFRQAMKAVLRGQLPPQSFAEEANQARMKLPNKSEPFQITEVPHPHAHGLRKTVQRRVQQNLYLKMKSAVNISTGNSLKPSGLKRRGRPMKAGPSRSAKAPSARKSLLYIGKLSNVVQFKRRWASESGSDADSIVYYY